MKFIDKVRNYFYDEEDETPKKDTAIKNNSSSTETNHKNKKEKESNDSIDNNVDVISERELFKSDPTFNFPVIFDDEDYNTEKSKPSRISTIEREQTKTEVIEKKEFKLSPNISPIYGVIASTEANDSNDHSDNLLNLYEGNKKVDIDDVLGKVYTQKRVEIKKDNYKEDNVDSAETEDQNFPIDFFNDDKADLLESITDDVPVNEEETIDNIDEQLRTIDELLENTDEEDFYSLVDSMYKNEDKEGDN